MSSFLKTLFVNPPSWQGFDGGAGSRYQAKREIRSFWYPTWLAQPAALIEGSRLVDAPPDDLTVDDVLRIARDYELVILHTSAPTLRGDAQLAEALKSQRSDLRVGLVGAHAAVLPDATLAASEAIDFVGRKEFDFTCQDVALGKPLADIPGLSFRRDGRIVHNPERDLIQDFDALPSVMDVYRRDLTIENYAIGYLQHPYVSHYTGRGCPAQCTFCLWPQTVGGHRYRAKSPEAVSREMAHAQRLFPTVKEFFFDDDTFTAYQPRAREIARQLGRLGFTWSCNARANVSRETLEVLRDNGLRLLLVGYESGNQRILDNIKKGIRLEEARAFTRHCRELGIVIHGTFILGLPGETRETIRETIEFAKEMDPFSMQVSLAAPYPGTELYRQAQENGWLPSPVGANAPAPPAAPAASAAAGGSATTALHPARRKPESRFVGSPSAAKDATAGAPLATASPGPGALVDDHGLQAAVLEYENLSREEIFASLDRFYKAFYLRPRPIARMLGEMLRDGRVARRRLREGVEFFRFLRLRSAAAS